MTPNPRRHDDLSDYRPPSFGTIVFINFKLAGAALMIAVAYYIYPSNPIFWGFAVLSIMLGIEAALSAIVAIGGMIALYMRDVRFERDMAGTRRPKSSRLADDDDLDSGGYLP